MAAILRWAAKGLVKRQALPEATEEETMIDFPVVDTHLHIWDPDRINYPWLSDVPFLNRAYLIDEYRKACGPVQVEKMVFVQAEADFSLYREEVEWVSSVSKEQDSRIQGIVAWAPLEKGAAVEPELAALAGNPLLRGIRRIIQFEDDIEFCLKPDFLDGVRLLPKYNLTFDICISHVQMANTIRMVQQCPEVTFILDHIGKPDIKNQVFEPWKSELRTLAGLPNVWCKMSGLVTEADMENWKDEDLRPYIDHVINCFGVDRVMYGGDWPVAFQATDYPRWVETLSNAVAGWNDADLRKLFRENAISFYRLG
jgi:L-fuconolactonase